MEKSTVAAVSCETYEPAEVRKAILLAAEVAGGLDWVQPGMKIGIKLNLCAAKKPESAAVTHPVLAAELCRLLTERGAEVVLGDSPGGPFTGVYLSRLYEATGVRLCEEAGGSLNTDCTAVEAEFPEGVSIKEFKYVSWMDRCDAIINFCKLKSHGLMGITAAVKNLYGAVPGTVKSEYHFLHQDPLDFANMLVDLNEYIRPRMVFCDAVDIMEGNGPTMGTPRHMGLLLASADPYRMDRVCAALLSVEESEIPFLTAAKQRGLLSAEPAEDEMFWSSGGKLPEGSPDGSGLAEIIQKYRIENFERSGATASWFIQDPADRGLRKIMKKGLYLLFRSKPAAEDSCIACGKCAENCPAKAIEIRSGKAHIRRSACVRCFCCQEFCPVGAMKVKRSAIARLLMK